MIRLWAKDLADSLAEECFTPEEVKVLEYQQGKRTITIAKQFLFFYGDYSTPYDREEFYDNFALILKEQIYMLDRLDLLQQKLQTLLEPNSYRDDSFMVGNVVTDGSTDENTTNETEYKSNRYHASNTESSSINKNTNVIKGGATQRSELYDVEREWIAQDIDTPEIRNIAKRKLGMNESDDITIDQLQTVLSECEKRNVNDTPINYNNVTFNKTSIGESLYSYLQSDHATKDRSNTNHVGTKGVLNNSTVYTNQHTYTYSEAQIIITSLNQEIPALRHEFWRTFLPLFNINV